MIDYIKRNIPVFVIGAITLTVFTVIIVLSQKQPDEKPNLVKIDEDKVSFDEEFEGRDFRSDTSDSFFSDSETTNTDDTPRSVPGTVAGAQTENTSPESTDTLGISDERETVVVAYTDEGFEPSGSRAKKGQTITFVNTTDRVITLEQLAKLYDELKEPVTLGPDQSFSFTLSHKGFWSFQEKETEDFGNVFIEDTD
jgi:plastocyanin